MRTRPLAALALAATLVFSPSPAHAAPSLSEYMETVEGNAWDKLQDWLELWHAEQHGEAPAPAPEPAPTQEPTPEPEPTASPVPALTDAKVVATADNKIVLTGRITGHEGEVTFRASANRLTGQAGYPVQGAPGADGAVRLEVEDINNTDPKFWQLELGGSTREYGEVLAAGDVTQAVSTPTPTRAPAPPATTEPAADSTTGGDGGAYTNRTFQNFASSGLTSRYHIYAEGIDRSKPVGLIMYGDGSGGYGFDNPGSSYLIGGNNGLAAVARKHNMILVVPEAPAPGCPSDNCWYDRTAPAKAKWASDLMTRVKGQYPIDQERIVTGGYSSGAQWHRWFLPTHGEAQSVDLAVMIAHGGAPAVSANYSTGYKDDLKLVWNTGTADAAYSTASHGARGGYNWYTQQGFDTEATWPNGVGHGRSGEFGGILDRGITQHLR